MNLDKLTVNIKPLTAYQAMDLGMAVARAYYGDLWRLWWRACLSFGAMFVVPLLILIGINFENSIGVYAVLGGLYLATYVYFTLNKFPAFFKTGLLWSLIGSTITTSMLSSFDDKLWIVVGLIFISKPTLERPLLIYLSQKLFNKDYQIDDLSDEFRSLGFGYLRGRIGLQRMMSMPVYLLENQSGKALKSRLKILTRNQSGAIHFHGLFFTVAELVLAVCSVWLLDIIISVRVEDGFSMTMTVVLVALAYLFAVAILAPFYVASGFVMYLCKRSLLEGWDIELVFYKLAHRHASMTYAKQEGRLHE